MIMSLGEIADRYSIVLLKSERTNLDVFDELDNLKISLERVEKVDIYVKELYAVNGQIWDLESKIRKGKEGELGLEEVGRRAIAIRELNGKRVGIKNKINEVYKSGFQETKIDHASS